MRCIVFEPYNGVDIEKPIEDFGGKTFYLFNTDIHRPSMTDDKLNDAVADRLKAIDYDPDADYIVASGNTIAVAILCAVAASDYGQFNALVYDKRGSEYRRMIMG